MPFLLASFGFAYSVREARPQNLHVEIAVGNTIAKIPASKARPARTGQKKVFKYNLYAKQISGDPNAIKQIEFFPDIVDNTYLPPSYLKKEGPPFVTEHDCWGMSTALLKVTMADGTVKKLSRRIRAEDEPDAKFRLVYKPFTVATSRSFGVEMELLAPRTFKPGKVRDSIKRVINQESIVTGYNQKTMKAWKIETDNSIRETHNACGLEVVSPILRGENGIDLITKVANEAAKQGCFANDSCGLHLHFDLTGVKFDQLKRMCQNWVKYEGAFDFLLSPQRSHNKYCRNVCSNMRFTNLSNREAHDLIGKQTTISGLVKLMNADPENRNRYYKLNLQNLVSKDKPRNTVEFRGPPGTCNPNEIEKWVRLFGRFIDSSISKPVCQPFKDGKAPNEKRRGLEKFIGMEIK